MSPLLIELIDLLTSGNMEETERAEAIRNIERAPEEYEWAAPGPVQYALALNIELHRHAASGDKVDEVFVQISEMMGPDLPNPPPGLRRCLQYFEWLDPHLADWDQEGGYDVVELDDHSGDRMNLYIVHRRDVPRILEIGTLLCLSLRRSLDAWREIEEGARNSPDYGPSTEERDGLSI